ncbi:MULTISPECIES: Nramp family divalent metal transporter [unclassified Cryobacterium]|uniref:Nramp family divalent metal transporter n=6 Tax=Cryobacterium TaxID=69578 RepID=UPI002AB57E67|nr:MULTISPECIES: Nramp family divalent metal transporter [unclassified Cryobacterium]MDY7526321.1 Nramp family divalent metal transporter [Cryobacterium sp. 10C2]MDY7528339.1 Nramp family divalent metal transporter [Cryobacterium sp. 10C2]MDY7540794.1 Nramp family divalent metal transporter [Cryobacterium sp. 5B3]MDY7544539.1 Nramp family divalent metal transporter [Cryobacterium sp. 5B3]MDY7555916.1 Nramp family divalent metal transporter [Cryobacterium sp. 10C3]
MGDIEGAMGTIRLGDDAPRRGVRAKLRTLLAILGPGLIVMVGDNDAGAFGTYTQAGQNYGTTLLWTLLLLVPVLYVNQEMVLRLGVVTGVGHARLILERFGKFWGAFSVIDLFILNALTIVTEFIGISLGLQYLGIPQIPGVIVAAVLVLGAVSTGSFKRFERVSMVLVAGSLLLVPIFFLSGPNLGEMATNFVLPGMPPGSQLSTVMLLIIGIVGTTVAPWQLFFQQSYVIDKRITPRFMNYEKVDLWIGILMVIVGAAAIIGFTSATFTGRPEFGNFTDALGVAEGLGKFVGRGVGVMFAIALIDASIIGAAAVGLSTSYALGDVLGLKHSLHRKPWEAKGFYAVFAALLALAATIVLIPGAPLGLLTVGVQTLAGVLLPSATVFLLLLCNDKDVLGPWVNGKWLNLFTSVVVAVLVMLSIILTASVLFPDITGETILSILGGGSVLGILVGATALVLRRRRPAGDAVLPMEHSQRLRWRMPPLTLLARPELSTGRTIGLGVLRAYLILAMVLVVVRVIQLALGH